MVFGFFGLVKIVYYGVNCSFVGFVGIMEFVIGIVVNFL